MLPDVRLTDTDYWNLRELRQRPDVQYRRRLVQLGERRVVVIERRATACRDLSRWLAFGWLLLVGLMGLVERREAR